MKKDKHPAHYVGANNGDRSKNDFYPTPEPATIALLNRETFPGVVWEPTAGKGHISNLLLEYGYTVYTSDIHDYGIKYNTFKDFFDFRGLPPGVKSIITNPPYLIKTPRRIAVEDWIQRAFDLGVEKTAFFLRTTSLGGIKRSSILENCGFSTMYQFRERLDIDREGGPIKSMIDYAWYVFERDYTGEPRIRWVTQETTKQNLADTSQSANVVNE